MTRTSMHWHTHSRTHRDRQTDRQTETVLRLTHTISQGLPEDMASQLEMPKGSIGTVMGGGGGNRERTLKGDSAVDDINPALPQGP